MLQSSCTPRFTYSNKKSDGTEEKILISPSQGTASNPFVLDVFLHHLIDQVSLIKTSIQRRLLLLLFSFKSIIFPLRHAFLKILKLFTKLLLKLLTHFKNSKTWIIPKIKPCITRSQVHLIQCALPQ